MKHILIIGSGMGGSILALELLRLKNHRVTLLDIDSLDVEVDRNSELEKDLDDGLQEQTTLGYGYGGSSNLWHGVMGLFDPEDWMSFEKKLGSRKLKDDVESGLPRLSEYFGKGLDFLRNRTENTVTQMSQWLDTSRLESKRYVVQLWPTRFREKIKAAKRRYPDRLTLCTNAVAIKLNVDDRGSIESITIVSDRGLEKLSADIFVASMGALESPRFLKQSFLGASVDNNVIGKGLMDHPHVIIGELASPKKFFYRQHAVNGLFARASNRIGFTVPVSERKSRELNHSIIVRPSFGDDEATSRAALKAIVQGGNFGTLVSNCFEDSTFRRAIAILACEKLGVGVYTNRFLVSLQLEQLQDNRGRVELTKDVDKFGRAIPKVTRYFSRELIEDLSHMKTLVRKLCKNGSNFKEFDVGHKHFLSGSHHSGTCRIGLSAADSVVDVNLKYHTIDNLYICDASIFPKIGNVNLSATIALFAVRLARRLNDLK